MRSSHIIIMSIGLILFMGMQYTPVHAYIQGGKFLAYSVVLEGTNEEVIAQIDWLGNLTVFRNRPEVFLHFDIRDVSQGILGVWRYAPDWDVDELHHTLGENYTSVSRMVNVTEFIVWTLEPRTVDWKARAQQRNGTLENNYTIITEYDDEQQRYREIRATSGETLRWEYTVDTGKGLLDQLVVKSTGSTIPGVYGENIYKVTLKNWIPFLIEGQLYQEVVLTVTGVLGVTVGVLTLVGIISIREHRQQRKT